MVLLFARKSGKSDPPAQHRVSRENRFTVRDDATARSVTGRQSAGQDPGSNGKSKIRFRDRFEPW